MRNLVLGSNSVRGKKKRRNIKKLVIRNAEVAVQTIRRRDLRTSTTGSVGAFAEVARAGVVRDAVGGAASGEGTSARPEVFVGTGVEPNPVPELTVSIALSAAEC